MLGDLSHFLTDQGNLIPVCIIKVEIPINRIIVLSLGVCVKPLLFFLITGVP